MGIARYSLFCFTFVKYQIGRKGSSLSSSLLVFYLEAIFDRKVRIKNEVKSVEKNYLIELHLTCQEHNNISKK